MHGLPRHWSGIETGDLRMAGSFPRRSIAVFRSYWIQQT